MRQPSLGVTAQTLKSTNTNLSDEPCCSFLGPMQQNEDLPVHPALHHLPQLATTVLLFSGFLLTGRRNSHCLRASSNLLWEKLLRTATRDLGLYFSSFSDSSESETLRAPPPKDTCKINLLRTGPSAPARHTCITQLRQWYLLVRSHLDSQCVSSQNELLPIGCFRAEESSSQRSLISEDFLNCLSKSSEEEGRLFIFLRVFFFCPTQSDQRLKSLQLMKEEQGN